MSGSIVDVSDEDIANKNFDALMSESEHFLDQIRSIPEVEGNYLMKFNAWRSKRRDKGLYHTMNNLIRRIKISEEQLRDNIIQIVEKKLALRDQARHLKCRLNSCIAYNTEYVQGQEQFVEEMRTSVNGLSSESSDVKAAVAFNCELVRQKIIQTVKQNRTFVSWGSKAVLLRPVSDQELSEDEDHPQLMQRLTDLRECREGLVSRLSNILEVRETHLNNLESCTKSSKKLVDLLRVTDDEALGSPPQLQSFDHSLCHDCAYVETITTDCVAHLEKLTQQTAESSQKLLWLVELREKVRENGEFLSNLEEEFIAEGGAEKPIPETEGTTGVNFPDSTTLSESGSRDFI
mmetsp:Transcript_28786/g.48557  ORF Transcript_28786/g.48557 Transcript_28786/m.48557 type:complete len:348 (+) Transcript_28786:228-1271(+)|eukprot:CAMPEP_0114429762 /NCGR_PEP_ID=MMETSP0103-20121206/9667_1 /TAXON_ID=37642 ORGANISM="Paraphysomonas imperforata, Strain PA2" /NCGR_SAMPLE_ID=MMETSP0103 /ASSEMBLY_ACC=CAM_ASM_000201 /LENGTH=347 /DNA_ID=CAMNT_0001599137 /DNA_START=180 /DNA_END=1223 /DNA_ORIENTATION=-